MPIHDNDHIARDVINIRVLFLSHLECRRLCLQISYVNNHLWHFWKFKHFIQNIR